jgi:hypothetical protein
MAPPRAWRAFDFAWRGALRTNRAPNIFHGKVFYNRDKISDPAKNPYLGWSQSQADKLISDLLAVIDGSDIFPVGAGVHVPAFNAVTYGERCLLAGYLTKPTLSKTSDPAPYHLAFRSMLLDALDKSTVDSELHITIAQQKDYQQRAGEVYLMTQSDAPRGNQLQHFGMEKPDKMPALQAADLQARHWNNFLVFGRARVNQETIQAMDVLARKRNDMLVCDAAAMEGLLAPIPADERKAIQEWVPE